MEIIQIEECFIDQPDMIAYLNAEMSAEEFLIKLRMIMPDAVKTYIETKDIREVDKVQRGIITLYKEDFSQYELENKKLRLKSIYDIIPAELNKQNKNQQSGNYLNHREGWTIHKRKWIFRKHCLYTTFCPQRYSIWTYTPKSDASRR